MLGILFCVAVGMIVILACFIVNFNVANNRTFEDRQRVMDEYVFGRPDWSRRLMLFRSVSYGKHLWYRETLRDPFKLYPASLFD